MNTLVMHAISKLCIKFSCTKWTFDLCLHVFPNSGSFDTTTSSSNAVFSPWIRYQVGIMNIAMFLICFSAYNNIIIVVPAMDYTVEVFYLG